MMLLLPSLFSRGRFVVSSSDDIMVDDEDDDDVGVEDDVGVSVGVGSVDYGGAPHGLRLFRCHYRGDGSRRSHDH